VVKPGVRKGLTSHSFVLGTRFLRKKGSVIIEHSYKEEASRHWEAAYFAGWVQKFWVDPGDRVQVGKVFRRRGGHETALTGASLLRE